MRYVRFPLPYSAESYTFISYVQSPTAGANALTNWGTMGAGTRLDYRLNQYFSVTADMTNSLFGGPAVTGTVELGTRFRPTGSALDSRMHPYMDARLGYVYSYESYMYSADPTAVNPVTIPRSRIGNGVGAMGGVGSDYVLTQTLAITTGLWATRTQLHAAAVSSFQPRPATYETYWMNTYRMAFGLKWNPVRAVASSGTR